MARNFNTPVRHTRRVGQKVAIGALAVLFMVFLIAVNVALFGLAIWALVFGIMDLAQNGVNPWAIIWIIVGGLVLLANLFRKHN